MVHCDKQSKGWFESKQSDIGNSYNFLFAVRLIPMQGAATDVDIDTNITYSIKN
jgi:hypothetical protein